MAKEINKLKEKLPELMSNEYVVSVADATDTLHSIKALMDQEGGRNLLALTLKSIRQSVDGIIGGYRTISHTELVALCASLEAHMAMARLLTHASERYEESKAHLEKEIDEALLE